MNFLTGMRICFLVGFVWAWAFAPGYAAHPTDSLLSELDQTLQQRPLFLKEKQERIASLKSLLNDENGGKNPALRTQIYAKLYNEYKSFVYDSAFFYASKLLSQAYQSRDPQFVNDSKLKVGFTLMSAGMLKETLDTLLSIPAQQLPDSNRQQYYSLLARTYYDLADYDQDGYFRPRYQARGDQYLKLALDICPPDTREHYHLLGWYHLRLEKPERAIVHYEHLLNHYSLSDNQFAIAASSLGAAYLRIGRQDKMIEWVAKAAMADIRSSTRETVATRILAEQLYRKGETQRAYRYVKDALEDAYAYGARHRKIQVSEILPIIEGNQLVTVEGQKKALMGYSVVLTLLSVLVVAFAFIIYRQNQRLKKTKESLAASNQHLQEANGRLQEANKIKEEYIGHFFNTISEYIEKIDKFKKSVSRKVAAKRMEEISDIIGNISLKAEREELYYSFDTIFLKLFPNFIAQYNAFFQPDAQIVWQEKEPLPTELRIFALIRLGIRDNERIAKILDYSVNTIYAYKTKAKNRSMLPNEKFEERLMEIKAS